MKINTRGITLIALVVTIVVLVILAAVSINLLLDENGVINRAKEGSAQYKMAELKERLEMELAAIQMDALLNGQELTAGEIANKLEEKFPEGNFSTTDGKNITIDIGGYKGTIDENGKVTIDGYEQATGSSGSGTVTAPDVGTTQVALADLEAGDYIKYDTGVTTVGENGVITCRVLYPASSQYGLQIISDKKVENVTLGGTDSTTAIQSYNTAITTLNNKALAYLNTNFASDARCVGTNPTNKAAESTNKATDGSGLELDVLADDGNFVTDQSAMQNANIYDSSETSQDYWLASRLERRENDGSLGYAIRRVAYDSLLLGLDASSYALVTTASGYTAQGLKTQGLRVCFTLKSASEVKITGGDGKAEGSAYTLGVV